MTDRLLRSQAASGVNRLIKTVKNLESQQGFPILTAYATVSNPPSNAEIEAAFDVATNVGTSFIGMIIDSVNGNEWTVWTDGLQWFLLTGAGGGVTTITAGNGLTGGGTGSVTITLGTPSSVTTTSTNSVTATSHTHAVDSTIARSAITITAGNGLTGGGDLTANRTITLGTPGSSTATSTNSVTTSSHTHAIDSTIARSTIIITAGNGLIGGGDLTINRTITLGTPSTLTVSTTNNVTATSHTHTITSSFDPGAAASLLASDSNGELWLQGLNFETNGTGINWAMATATHTAHILSDSDRLKFVAGADGFRFRNRTDASTFIDVTSGGLIHFPAGTGVVIGTVDTPQGYLLLHGNSTGQTRGAEIDLTPAADYKAGIGAWRIAAFEDDLRFSIVTGDVTEMTLNTSGHLQVERLGAGIVPGVRIHAVDTTTTGIFQTETTSSGVPTVQLRNPNTTDNNNTAINSYTNTTGTGATTAQLMSAIRSRITVHDHATRASQYEFYTSNGGNATLRMTIAPDGRVGIGTVPDTYGILDIASTVGALIVPRMTTTQRDAMTAVEGMIIYNTSITKHQAYSGAGWITMY